MGRSTKVWCDYENNEEKGEVTPMLTEQGESRSVLGWLRYWLSDIVVLSFCRLTFFGWLLVILWDGVHRLILVESDQPPLFGSNGILAEYIACGGIILFGSVWWLAEEKLDQTRHAHRRAYEDELPQAQAKISELEATTREQDGKLRQTQYDLAQTQRNLEREKASGERNTLLIKKLQAELDQTKAHLRSTQTSLDEARETTAQTLMRLAQAQADQKAITQWKGTIENTPKGTAENAPPTTSDDEDEPPQLPRQNYI